MLIETDGPIARHTRAPQGPLSGQISRVLARAALKHAVDHLHSLLGFIPKCP